MNPSDDALTRWGWNEKWQEAFGRLASEGTAPGRVVREDRGLYTVQGAADTMMAEVSGRFRHEAGGPADFPAVGDWIVITEAGGGRAVVHAVLPRRSVFQRQEAGNRTQAQVVAANVDTVFLVSGLDHDFNPRRIERYVTVAWESGAQPVVVLNKADLCPEPEACVSEAEGAAPGAAVHLLSAQTGAGLEQLQPYLEPGRTVALLGSSGAGKSSLINALAGTEVMRTGAVREDDSRGRHTTTHRQLLALPCGALVLDTPGMRELKLWAGDEALSAGFSDIEALARDCRFRDCTHNAEPGCAVRESVESGALPEERVAGYHKLQREAAYLARRQDQREANNTKKRWKQISKEIRRIGKAKR